MNHTQVRAFHAVASLGSFSKAADALLLTQPAVSEQVRRLEQDNDILLFRRSRRGVDLTDAGRRLFKITNRYFDVASEVDACLSEWNDRLAGQLRLVVDSTQHVTDVIGNFRSHFPDVKVSVRSGNTESIINDLRNYAAEIGVIGSVPNFTDMECLEIGSSPIIAFAREDVMKNNAPLMSMKEVVKYPVILREPGSKTREHVLKAARKSDVRLEPAIEAEGRESVRALVTGRGRYRVRFTG